MNDQSPTFEARLAEAISRGEAAEFVKSAEATQENQPVVLALGNALAKISSDMRDLNTALSKKLSAANCEVEARSGPEEADALQYPELCLRVAPHDLGRAASVLASEGFAPPFELTPGRISAIQRFQSSLRLVRFDGDTTRVSLEFADPRPASKLRPSMADISDSAVPPAFTSLLMFRRVWRLIWERLKGGVKGATDTEYLGTPQSLIPKLIELAGPPEQRHLMDLGCGDGRIVVAAAQAGWRATGIELNTELAQRARRNAAEAGLASKVRILCQPAQEADLTDVDVLFLFLPLYILRPILNELLQRQDLGARIILHEQHALPPEFTPDRSVPIISENALTVAHIWES